MNRPSFLCIGAQKAATSWLDSRLRQHPEIWMPPFKELHYFDHVHVPDNRKWTPIHLRKGIVRAMKTHLRHRGDDPDMGYLAYLAGLGGDDRFTDDWYLRCFDRPDAAGKTLGEITPEYCTLPDAGIAHVRELLGEVKLIYIIRDPVERARSQLRMTLGRKFPKRLFGPSREDLEAAVAQTPVENRGDYAAYIPRWIEAFGASSILFLPFGQVSRDPRGVLEQVERHLGVTHHDGWRKLEEAVHVTRKVRLPESALDSFRDHFDAQYTFLERQFDPEFLAQL